MSRRPPKSTLPDPLLPSTPLFRSLFIGQNLLERLAVSQQPSQPAAPLAGVLIPGLGPGQPRREPVQAVVQLQGERGGKIGVALKAREFHYCRRGDAPLPRHFAGAAPCRWEDRREQPIHQFFPPEQEQGT